MVYYWPLLYIDLNGENNKITKPVKKNFLLSAKSLAFELETVLPKYLTHEGNIVYQYKELRTLKDN